jgi:hypothetical protein
MDVAIILSRLEPLQVDLAGCLFKGRISLNTHEY